MPIYKYENLEINYIRKGNGKPVVFLHGWGTNIESFSVLTDKISKTHEVIALDFPGFGKSQEPISPWNLDDYTQMTYWISTTAFESSTEAFSTPSSLILALMNSTAL